MQKIRSDTEDLSNSIYQSDLIDIYRTLHTTIESALISNTDRAFIKIDQILGHKTSVKNLGGIKSGKVCAVITMEIFYRLITEISWK